tara:strand:- start:8422 stop:8709 length:288 start_codon:yes stop_codon:yes gene_type:complete
MNQKFKINQSIIVDQRNSDGHSRTPGYIRGKVGKIERICGSFPNPEQIAKCHPKPDILNLYRCTFYQKDVWNNYLGNDQDTIELEIYEHWLLPNN